MNGKTYEWKDHDKWEQEMEKITKEKEKEKKMNIYVYVIKFYIIKFYWNKSSTFIPKAAMYTQRDKK